MAADELFEKSREACEHILQSGDPHPYFGRSFSVVKDMAFVARSRHCAHAVLEEVESGSGSRRTHQRAQRSIARVVRQLQAVDSSRCGSGIDIAVVVGVLIGHEFHVGAVDDGEGIDGEADFRRFCGFGAESGRVG